MPAPLPRAEERVARRAGTVGAVVQKIRGRRGRTPFAGLWIVAADVAGPAYFGRCHLGSIRSIGFSVGVAGAALGPLPFGLAYDLLGGYDPAIAALLALPIAATAAVLLAKPPALIRPAVAARG